MFALSVVQITTDALPSTSPSTREPVSSHRRLLGSQIPRAARIMRRSTALGRHEARRTARRRSSAADMPTP